MLRDCILILTAILLAAAMGACGAKSVNETESDSDFGQYRDVGAAGFAFQQNMANFNLDEVEARDNRVINWTVPEQRDDIDRDGLDDRAMTIAVATGFLKGMAEEGIAKCDDSG